ncbi:unnamed protein product, partial [Clonostachys rosea f. rosea IK726]
SSQQPFHPSEGLPPSQSAYRMVQPLLSHLSECCRFNQSFSLRAVPMGVQMVHRAGRGSWRGMPFFLFPLESHRAKTWDR